MDRDNNGERLPTGYGRSFDYARGPRTHALHIPGIFPCFDFIREMELSGEIEEWYNRIKQESMATGFTMELTRGGINGSYYCVDRSRRRVAVFKPFDEEDKAPYYRRTDDSSTSSAAPVEGSTGSIPGTKIGKGAAREVATFLLDHPTKGEQREGFTGNIEGFCGVPPTLPITCMHKAMNYRARGGSDYNFEGPVKFYKYGSLQKYMENDGHCSDSGSEDLAVDDMHKICLLDIRFANADRHFGNLLVKNQENGQVKLIPIDHGYCFPENFKRCRFDWLRIWKHPTREHFNSEAMEYIDSLDSEKDIDLLIRNHFTMSYTFARSLHISTRLLKEGVKRRLTPFEIGHFMSDEPRIEHSDDEVDDIVHEACSSLLNQCDYRNESVLQMIVSEAIRELVRNYLGNGSVNDMDIIRMVEKESKLGELRMTKQEVETQLLKIVFENMDRRLEQYADELRVLRS